MHLSLSFQNQDFVASGASEVDLSIAYQESGGASAWYVSPMKVEPVRANGFLGSVAEGGDVNFRDVQFNPHGNGTHTECLGHISPEAHSINQQVIPAILPCLIVSIVPEKRGEDQLVTLKGVQQAISAVWNPEQLPPAFVLRTLPNDPEKRSRNWSSTNPPYLDAELAQWFVDSGVDHLLLDLPSVDREADGGALAAHHAFWQYPENPRHHATITEFIFVPDQLEDGAHILNLQTAAFELDATPSRPIIIPCLAR